MRQYLREILHLLGDARRKLPWLVLLFLGSSLLDLVGIGLVGPYVALVANPAALDGRLGDLVSALGVPRDQRTVLTLLGLVLVGAFLLKAVAAIGIQGVIVRFSQGQQARLQSVLMRAYQHLPYTEYLRRNSSEYVHSIGGLTVAFSHVVQIGLKTVSDGIVALVLLGLLAWQNAPALALLCGLLLTVMYGYDRLFRRNLRSYGEQSNRAWTTLTRGIHEGIEGLKEIRILGKEDHFHRLVQRGAQDIARFTIRTQMISLVPRYLLELVMVAFLVILVLLILSFGRDLGGLMPTLGVFGVAALRLMPAASALSGSLLQLRYNRDAVSRLYRDLADLSRVRLEAPKTAGPIPTEPFRTLALDRVRFSYPNAAVPALHDLSMTVRAGESIGLIGPSGSGKTTLVDLLLGLLEPQQGELRYNDRPMRDAIGQWRAQVAYLPQQVFLIDDTLRRNVALGVADEDIDDARLHEALRQARLAELVAELPQGADTVLGERGVRLSGGQRQRVALARAFYHARSVLVMDEATSALDNDTEREIVEEIRRLRGQKTLIVIAHRLTTVQYCDRIYRLRNGTIVEHGTYDEVVRQKAVGSPNASDAQASPPQSTPAAQDRP